MKNTSLASRIKEWFLAVLELLVSSGTPPDADKNDWWKYNWGNY